MQDQPENMDFFIKFNTVAKMVAANLTDHDGSLCLCLKCLSQILIAASIDICDLQDGLEVDADFKGIPPQALLASAAAYYCVSNLTFAEGGESFNEHLTDKDVEKMKIGLIGVVSNEFDHYLSDYMKQSTAGSA